MAAETNTDTGFIVDGDRYPIIPLDTFTLDEAQILYDYSGLTLEDFAPLLVTDLDEDEVKEFDRKFRNPGFLRALVHVAYQRAHPNMSPAKVRRAIGEADLIENFDVLHGFATGDDAVPPASTTEPERSSVRSSVDSNENSGTGSSPSSDEPAGQPEPITTGESDTSLASVLTSSAA